MPDADYLDDWLRERIGKRISLMVFGVGTWWGSYELVHVGTDYITLRGNHDYQVSVANLLVVREDA